MAEGEQPQPPAPTENPHIHRVGVKPVAFVKSEPDLYFFQMEAQFRNAGIIKQQTKFDWILASLDPNYLCMVSDLVRNPPLENQYETLKSRLIKEFSQSDQHKLRVLLKETELGDAKPSQLLRKMKDLSRGALNDEEIKSLWIERLPEPVRAVISISEGNSEHCAKMADKMLEVTSFSQVTSVEVPQSSEISVLTKKIDELTKQFSQYKFNRSRSHKRDFQKRDRSQSVKNKNDRPFCRYHFKYGAMANKCEEPCQFVKKQSENLM